MTDPIAIGIPERETAELKRIMAKRSRLLGEDSKKTVSYGSWFVARAAGAATKVAPKVRPILKNKLAKGGDRRRAPFVAKKFTKSRDIVLIPIKAETKAEARLDKRAKIGNRGLARDAWRWVVGALGRSTGKISNKRRASYYRVQQFLTKISGPEILLQNRLAYAGSAFRTGGKGATVSSIMSRAANAMRKDLDRRAKRTIKGTN